MGWLLRKLSRLLGSAPAEEREGIRFPSGPHWDVDCPCAQFPELLRSLPELMPHGSTLYLEGRPDADIRVFLETHAVENPVKVEVGTLWPRPLTFHVALTRENMKELAELAEGHVIPGIADHLHVYLGTQVILSWYDTMTDPLCVSKEMPEASLDDWCAKLGLSYRECSKEV